MIQFIYGKPTSHVLNYMKSKYVPRSAAIQIQDDLRQWPYGNPYKLTIDTSHLQALDSIDLYKEVNLSEIDLDFDGNILEVYDEQTNARRIEYEPYTAISLKGQCAKYDFCLYDPSRIAKIHKLSRNFSKIGSSFNQLPLLECINAPEVEQLEDGAFSKMRNLAYVSLPKLSLINNTQFQYDFKLHTVRLPSVSIINGPLFQGNRSLEVFDLGTSATRSKAPTLEVANDIYLNYFFSPISVAYTKIYVPIQLMDSDFSSSSIGRWGRVRRLGESNGKFTFIGQ